MEFSIFIIYFILVQGQDIPIAINQSFQVMAGKLDVNDIKGVVKVSKEEGSRIIVDAFILTHFLFI